MFKSMSAILAVIVVCQQVLTFSAVVRSEDAPKLATAQLPSIEPSAKPAIDASDKIETLVKQHEIINASNEVAHNNDHPASSLEARLSGERNFIKDIIDRLHALDADIGKLVFNSTSMYAPNDQTMAFQEQQPKGGERFTELLADLDSLQDEIGSLINNATRTRQYNMLVRLRPINTIVYRIRNNLHLMRNSLVAINTVASLERLGNNVLDSTLQAFLRPETNATDEIGDTGNYDIDLDKLVTNEPNNKPAPLLATSSTTLTPSTTSTTTTPKPTTASTTTSTSTTEKPLTSTTRSSSRPINRRVNNRQGQRRNTTRRTSTLSTTTTTSSTTTLKPHILLN